MGTIDRISELPIFILHAILSNLDTKEAGRVSVLSKRWYEAWSSVPFLNFRHEYYRKKSRFDSMKYYNYYFSVDKNAIPRFLKFIDRTMHRYDTQKYRIRKFNLELPITDKKIQPLVDKWICIAVQNQVEELCINRSDPRYSYTLPEILFRAKSLKVLKCSHVVLPYYETMELISLEYLDLRLCEDVATVDTDMLQRIIAFCPLVEFNTLTGHKFILLSWKRKVNKEDDVFGKFKASSLRKFTYHVFNKVVQRPLDMKLVALKNLRKVEISGARITDDIVSELVSGLVALESLVLDSCSMLKCIMISSISLKELRIRSGLNLVKVTIDAPNLIEFWYKCEVETSLSLIRKSDHCNAQFSLTVRLTTESVTTDWFVKIKKILQDSNVFQSLLIQLPNSMFKDCLEVVAEEDQLRRNVVTNPPYKLRELKLHGTREWYRVESPLTTLNGLFWICHPDVLSILTSLEEFSDETILLEILKCKVQCWKHPLKSIEFEGIDRSRLLSYPGYIDYEFSIEYRFRLSWFEV